MPARSQRSPRKRFKSQFRIYLGDEVALGPGKAELLQHIAETGSIAEAARRMDMSYNRAWLLVRTMNRSFKEPVVLSTRGGDTHGGAEVTKMGRQILILYGQLESQVVATTRPVVARILSHLK